MEGFTVGFAHALGQERFIFVPTVLHQLSSGLRSPVIDERWVERQPGLVQAVNVAVMHPKARSPRSGGNITHNLDTGVVPVDAATSHVHHAMGHALLGLDHSFMRVFSKLAVTHRDVQRSHLLFELVILLPGPAVGMIFAQTFVHRNNISREKVVTVLAEEAGRHDVLAHGGEAKVVVRPKIVGVCPVPVGKSDVT